MSLIMTLNDFEFFKLFVDQFCSRRVLARRFFYIIGRFSSMNKEDPLNNFFKVLNK